MNYKDTGWEGILRPDETVLWQGKPDGSIELDFSSFMTFAIGLGFAGFSIAVMIVGAGMRGFGWQFGFLHLLVGLSMAFGALFKHPMQRRRTWYTLTDRRAIIARNPLFWFKSLDSYLITKDTEIHLFDGALGKVVFGTKEITDDAGTRDVRFGFERIRDDREVYRIMRDLQDKLRAKDETGQH